ncbi:phosphotransferase family protein [Variovorax rhizosphaerae]|uniref:Phosphotransferase family protein n=1 Tax=Variovorax rhizosphaerae TaxID=1836200 RepID=A0ABU8WNP6_9BURK
MNLPAHALARPVVSAPPLDLARLGAWLEAHAEGFRGLRKAERFVGGNSNPIWRVEADSGRYILRTQPAGELLKSAHALDREARVLKALQGSAVPVPRLRVLCNDLDVVGVQFYLMDFMEGTVHRSVALPDVPRDKRGAIYAAAIDSLVAIHRTDLDALGLRDFGRPGNYFERQLHRWSQQYRTAMPEGSVPMDALIARLDALLPHGEHPVTLLHGDSRIDNLMFDARGERVIAVLDWELSTLGHPLADLGQFLAVQELPADYLLPGLRGVDRAAEGLPTAAQLAQRYFGAMGMDPATDLRFFRAFAMFRQAAMSAGLRRRAALGTAVAESALYFGNTMDVFAQTGLDILEPQRQNA